MDGLGFPERLMLIMANWMDGLIPTNYPGVWKTKMGYRVRVRAIDPNTAMRKEANRTIDGITLKDAVKRQVEMCEDLLRSTGPPSRPRVGEFARSWIESKSAIIDEYTLTNYADALERHILPMLDEKRDAMHAVAATMRDVKLGVVRGGKGDGRGYDRGYHPENEHAA